MGDLVSQIKNITSNKNTVTVLGVVLAIFVIYVAYTIRVNNAVSPISVPYASQQISPGTKITDEYISYRNVPPGLLKGKVITNANAVLNKYVSPNSIIPEGSLFYESAVIDKDRSAALLARKINADILLILTAIDKVYLNYNTDNQIALDKLTVSDAKKYINEGHFAKGSMLPKIEACIDFVNGDSSKKAIIGSLEEASLAIKGESGTIIIDK